MIYNWGRKLLQQWSKLAKQASERPNDENAASWDERRTRVGATTATSGDDEQQRDELGGVFRATNATTAPRRGHGIQPKQLHVRRSGGGDGRFRAGKSSGAGGVRLRAQGGAAQREGNSRKKLENE